MQTATRRRKVMQWGETAVFEIRFPGENLSDGGTTLRVGISPNLSGVPNWLTKTLGDGVEVHPTESDTALVTVTSAERHLLPRRGEFWYAAMLNDVVQVKGRFIVEGNPAAEE